MKLLVFAHVPPPHHGQSYMVQLLLDGLGAEANAQIEVIHVDARFSDDIRQVGVGSVGKGMRAISFVARAVAARVRHGVKHFYYVPAPPHRTALYRDWFVMAVCRPFFPYLILHWHAVGLGEWLEHGAHPVERWITRRLLGRPALSIVLGEHALNDAQALASLRTVVIPNGIPDPCPSYDEDIRPQREARARARAVVGPTSDGEPLWFTAVFLGLCIRSKGLFDALDGVALANARLAGRGHAIRIRLEVAGAFVSDAERAEFDARLAQPDLAVAGGSAARYRGFVSGEGKQQLLADADVMVFPTYYEAEGQSLVVIESLAYDLPVVVSRWRAVPELVPDEYPYLVEPRAPDQVARALVELIDDGRVVGLRARFLDRYTETRFVADVRRAVLSVPARP